MGAQEGATYRDALLQLTYHELQASDFWSAAGGERGVLLNGYADGAMIPSTIAQAMQSIFRFRELEMLGTPLSSFTDYELLRSYMASGEEIARTMYGPVRFDATGANAGREPTTFQFAYGNDANASSTPGVGTEHGVARVIFPAALAEAPFAFPAPSWSGCDDGAWLIADVHDTCLLCAPSVCIDYAPPPPMAPPPPEPTDLTLVISVTIGTCSGLLGLLLLGLLVRWLRNLVQQAKAAHRAEIEQHEQRVRRLHDCCEKIATLEFSLCLVRLKEFCRHGQLLPHEEVRRRGELTILDTFEEVRQFVVEHHVIFVSHQVLASHPKQSLRFSHRVGPSTPSPRSRILLPPNFSTLPSPPHVHSGSAGAHPIRTGFTTAR